MTRFGFLVLLLTASGVRAASAQNTSPWHWQADGSVFAGLNYQHRKFTDFHALESQNWVMGTGEKPVAGGHLQLSAMLSLEPFTMKKIGSPQVFQTGETFQHAPIIDYQHPHDLVTALGSSYDKHTGAYLLSFAAALVGSPALGPQAFMHRASAVENPQAPLSHHNLDSTHVTPGVLTLGISRSTFRAETSWFRGREPDENRTDIDLGALDSWSLRGTWTRGAWNAQVSGGHLHNPDITEPGRDLTRLTASAAYAHSGPVQTALFLAWGQNREVHGPMNAVLFESTTTWRGRNYLYSRAELVTKDILNAAGNDPLGFLDVHPLSRVGAFTAGYTRDLNGGMRTRIGLGGDVTVYRVPPNLRDNYGRPVSFHLFLRFRFTSAGMLEGMQMDD